MSPKVLVVDDSMTMRKINSKILREIGVTDISEARNGLQAFEMAEKDTYDLILLDINMPIMDGIECLGKLKSNEKTQNIPVIIVTSEPKKEMAITTLESGASGYITKPIQKDELKSRVDSILNP